MKKILVIKLSALGDVVQAEGAMHDIRLHHPDDSITVLTTPAYKKYMQKCPWVDEILIDPRVSRFRLGKMLSLRKYLRHQHFDFVYDLQQVSRTAFYHRWFLFDVDWMGGGRGCRYRKIRPSDRCAADHFAEHLTEVGLEVQHTKRCDLGWMADDVQDIFKRYQLKKGYVVLIPGASSGHDEKRWPYFGQLAEVLLSRGYQVVTVPGPDEMDLCSTIAGEMLTEADGSFLNIFRLAGILQHAGFIIGNDTGPTHIGVHMQVPGLALFNNRIPATFTGIQHGRFNWLQVDKLADLSIEKVISTTKLKPINCQEEGA